MMVIPARTQERGLVAVALSHLEAEDIAVEAERLIDVRDLQMDVSDVHARVDRLGHAPSLRAGARLALPPASRPYGPQGSDPFIAAKPRAPRATSSAFMRPDMSPPPFTLPRFQGANWVRNRRRHLLSRGFQTPFDASRKSREDARGELWRRSRLDQSQ